MLHVGHINLLIRAKERGDYLIVGVTSEDYDRSRGKLNVVQSQKERMDAIRSLDFVDEVILETHKNQKQEDIVKYDIDEFVIGDDWIGKFDYLKKYCDVIYLPRTEGISSTLLREQTVKAVNVGVVGTSGDSKRFLRECAYVKNIKPRAIYSKEQKKIEKFKKLYSIELSFSNVNDFLKSDIDAVYIASDLKDHYKFVKKALFANKHVLCENPLTINNDDAKELFSLAKKKNKLLLVALKTAFAPAFNKMIEISESGVIGDIKEVRATFTSLYKERGFSKRYIENGATNLLMNYPSLIVSKVAGKFKTIDYYDQISKKGYDTSNRVITRHKNNLIGVSTVGIEMKSDGHAIISGTKGYIYIPAPWWLTKEFFVKFEDTAQEVRYEYEFKGDGLRYMIAEFSSLIQRGLIESERLTINDMIEINRYISEYNKRGRK